MSNSMDNQQNPDALEREVNARRANLNQTLNAVEAKLSSSHLMEQTMDYLGTHGGDIAGSVSRSVKENPLPLLLTGVGIAWLISSQSKAQSSSRASGNYRARSGYPDERDHYSSPYSRSAYAQTNSSTASRQATVQGITGSMDDESGLADQARDKVSELSDNAQAWKEDLTTQLQSLKQDAEETADDWRERVINTSVEQSDRFAAEMQYRNQQMSTQFQDSAESARNWMQEQPLVAGALGVALGALLGSLLPSTKTENELVGQSADDVKDNLADKAQTLTASAASTVADKSEELRKKGEKKVDAMTAKQTSEKSATAEKHDSKSTTV